MLPLLISLNFAISLHIAVIQVQNAEVDCTAIPELANTGGWNDWCNKNCGTPPDYAPACNGDGVHVKCKCGQNSGNVTK